MFNSNIKYFETRLPIQLDASCNGYQHISLLTSDSDLFKEVNLSDSTKEDIPKDFYSYLALKLKDYLKECLDNNLSIKKENLSLEDRESYTRLYNINIPRPIIKKPIMTNIYNASFYAKFEYFKESFEYDKENNIYININDPTIVLEFIDFNNLEIGLTYILYRDFPRLKKLKDYLKEVATICTKLNIYIP
jgi:DNA-directed RNA polymerase